MIRNDNKNTEPWIYFVIEKDNKIYGGAGISQLKKIKIFIKKRRQIAEIYTKNLSLDC